MVPTFTIAPPPKTEEEIIADGIRSVLSQARSLIASPENWLQGDSYERTSDGTEKYSFEGAINLSFVKCAHPDICHEIQIRDFYELYCTPPHDWFLPEFIDNIRDAVIYRYWPPHRHPGSFNEDPRRRHNEVLLALDYCIAEAPNWVQHYWDRGHTR